MKHTEIEEEECPNCGRLLDVCHGNCIFADWERVKTVFTDGVDAEDKIPRLVKDYGN